MITRSADSRKDLCITITVIIYEADRESFGNEVHLHRFLSPFKNHIIELTLSQEHSSKAKGVYCMVSNMLKVNISQAKFCFLEQTSYVYEIRKSS